MNFRTNIYTPPAVKYLILANVIFYIASILIPGDIFTIYLGLHYIKSPLFNPVQFITYMFLHDTTGLSHIFFNMFGLWMFGRSIEETLGTKRFLIFYFVTGVGAAIVQEITWYLTIGNAPFDPITVGASGALFGLLVAFAILFPKADIFLFFIPIPIKAPIFVAIYAALELFLGVSSAGDGVAHYAHIGGLLFGLVLLLIWRNNDNGYNLLNKTNRWFKELWTKIKGVFKRRPEMKYKKPDGNASDAAWNQYSAEEKRRKNERIDIILEKIKKSGYQALTEEEKRELFDMSRK